MNTLAEAAAAHMRARGFSLKLVLWLALGVLFAGMAARVSVALRTPQDQDLVSPVLDNGVLVGMTVPLVILTFVLRDRTAWLLNGSSRVKVFIRAMFIAMFMLLAMSSAGVVAMVAPRQLAQGLIAADFLLLTALALLASILGGVTFAPVLPSALALACSIPGLIPLDLNLLVRVDRTDEIIFATLLILALAIPAFLTFDSYGVGDRASRKIATSEADVDLTT